MEPSRRRSGTGKDVIRLEREPVIMTMKPKLVMGLADTLEMQPDKESFLVLCRRIEAVIRAWYHVQFEELMQLYSLFDPANGGKKLDRQNLPPHKVEELEQRFLGIFFQVMAKSNFKLITDEEYRIATSSQYLLNLPIAVNKSKLDSRLLARYFETHPFDHAPAFRDQYAIFRRGIGIDRSTGTFVNQKIDVLVSRLWGWIMKVSRLERLLKRVDAAASGHLHERSDDERHDSEEIERIRLQNMKITPRDLLKSVTLQEPAFERVVVLYRLSTPANHPSPIGERAIHIKQFKHIPMADMEIVLPEKKNPSLTAMDWLKFLISAAVGFAAFIKSLDKSQSNVWVAFFILTGFLSYCARIFFTFQANIVEYQRLITNSMYDKQLDSGRGTLLHLCDDVIQQEVKEVIIAYYVLMTQGKQTIQRLDELCEELLAEEFGESCNFEVDDAVKKLERLGIVTKDALGRYSHNKRANDLIGVTTDELVAKDSVTSIWSLAYTDARPSKASSCYRRAATLLLRAWSKWRPGSSSLWSMVLRCRRWNLYLYWRRNWKNLIERNFCACARDLSYGSSGATNKNSRPCRIYMHTSTLVQVALYFETSIWIPWLLELRNWLSWTSFSSSWSQASSDESQTTSGNSQLLQAIIF